MVDKTIPYKNIIMVADNLTEQKPTLPEGFYLDTYREGDELAWAEMEHYAGDFSTVERGIGYFKSAYLLSLDSPERLIAVRNPEGKAVAYCTAWRSFSKDEVCNTLQFLVTAEGYEGMGLARAAAMETINRYIKLGAKRVYLHTQPWSYKAIWLYHQVGFRISRSADLQTFGNDCDEALEILETLIPADKMKQIRDGVID